MAEFDFNEAQKKEIVEFAEKTLKESPEKTMSLVGDKIVEVATRQ